jgi:hypothetical protein
MMADKDSSFRADNPQQRFVSFRVLFAACPFPRKNLKAGGEPKDYCCDGRK